MEEDDNRHPKDAAALPVDGSRDPHMRDALGGHGVAVGSIWMEVNRSVDAIAALAGFKFRHLQSDALQWRRIDILTSSKTPMQLVTPVDAPFSDESFQASEANFFVVTASSEADISLEQLPSAAKAEATGVVEGRIDHQTAAGPLVMTLPMERAPSFPTTAGGFFIADAVGPAAERLIGRLLRLGHDDATLSEWGAGDRRELLVSCRLPPLFLVMQAFEEPDQGVRFFSEAEPGLFVEWGFAHPLQPAAATRARERDNVAVVDRDGEWRLLPSQWSAQPVLDIVQPLLPTEALARVTMAQAPVVSDKFEIRLRLEGAETGEPELWLVDADRFERLGEFLYSAPPDDVARLSIARLATESGRPIYMVRERTKPGETPSGRLISDLLDARGFARMEGTENFYLPVGRQLRPRLRREDLRSLLSLDHAAIVLLEEDADGIRLTTSNEIDERPLADWVELVATDRRRELDRMLEDAVLTFPTINVETPPRPERKRRPPPPAKAKRGKPISNAAPLERPSPPEAAVVSSTQPDAEALLAQARPLEVMVAAGGHAKAATWISLGHIREALEQEAQAAGCFEVGLFFLGEPALASALDDDGAGEHEVRSIVQRMVTCRQQPFGTPSDDDEEFIELLTKDHKTMADASRLGALALMALVERRPVALDVVAQISSVFKDHSLPVSRRLAWSVLLACHLVTDDALGLTRAKESILGGLNEQGLNEAYDLPRFVRLELALEDASNAAEASRSNLDQLNTLESLWDAAGGDALDGFDVDIAYLRAQFGVGFARLGAVGNARALVRPLEEELPAHDEPNRALLSLYLGRLAHAATKGESAAWREEVTAALASIENVRVRRTVEWLRKRSSWLNPERDAAPAPWIRPDFEKKLAAAEDAGRGFAQTISEAFRTPELYDYELSSSIDRMLGAALATGVEATLVQALDVAQANLGHIQILGHRAFATGMCIRAAATLGDLSRVDAFLQTVVEIARAPNVPSMRALLAAIEPALTALRRLGGSESGIRFLGAIEKIDVRSASEQVRLNAAIADGLMNLKVIDRPMALIDAALETTLQSDMDHVGRFEAATAIVTSLHHWPLHARAERCRTLLENLSLFRDTFTTSAYFGTHRILLCEAIIDAMCDFETLQTDKVHAFLDAEEQRIRQVIAADWSALCGR